MEAVSGIPVVDFTAMSVNLEATPPPSDARVEAIARQIHEAFSTVGFVYLKNHGITQEKVRKLLSFQSPSYLIYSFTNSQVNVYDFLYS